MCRDTVKEIVKYYKTTIIYDERLRERDFGIFNGKKGKDNDWKSVKGELIHQKPSGGERFYEVIIQVKSFFDEFVMNEENNILIVTHRGIIKAILNILCDQDVEKLIHKEKQKNTTLHIIEKLGEKFSLLLENCDVHNN